MVAAVGFETTPSNWMFWIGVSNDIKQLAENCAVCQQTKPCNSKEPLQQHAEGRMPWEKCGVDLFEFNQK